MKKQEKSVVDPSIKASVPQGQKHSSEGKFTMSCRAFCCCVFFTGAILSFILSTILLFGVENYHKADPVKIYEVFQTPKYALTNELLDKTKYLILYGQASTGIINFIEHEANLRVIEGQPVIIRELDENIIKKHIKETKHFVEMYLGHIGRGRHTWFLLLNDTQAPTHQISSLQNKYPHDTIVVLTPKKLEIENFTTHKFPPLKKSQLQEFMEKDLDMDEGEIKQIFDQSESKNIHDLFVSYKHHEEAKVKAAEQAQKLRIQREEEQRKFKEEEEKRKQVQAQRVDGQKDNEDKETQQQESKSKKSSKKSKGKPLKVVKKETKAEKPKKQNKAKEEQEQKQKEKQKEEEKEKVKEKEKEKEKKQKKQKQVPKPKKTQQKKEKPQPKKTQKAQGKKSSKKSKIVEDKVSDEIEKALQDVETKAKDVIEQIPVTVNVEDVKVPKEGRKGEKSKKGKKSVKKVKEVAPELSQPAVAAETPEIPVTPQTTQPIDIPVPEVGNVSQIEQSPSPLLPEPNNTTQDNQPESPSVDEQSEL